jgi:DNA polymerase III epsilon subunit-like protein
MSVPKLVYVDTETAGLIADFQHIWEIGLIDGDTGEEHHWWLEIDASSADPIGLSIGRYHERHPFGNNYPYKEHQDPEEVVYSQADQGVWSDVAHLTHKAHLVGAVVSFDEERMRRAMLLVGVQPSWHYHVVDVEAYCAGQLQVHPPWNSEELSYRMGVDPTTFDRHTALGDARWAAALYTASHRQKGLPIATE